jgi:cytochrome c-type biogenesis protein
MNFALPAIYGAGLLTFVSPCVLPLIPIYLAALLGGAPAGEARARLMLRAGLFSAGFVAVFTVLGLTASSLGSLLAAHRNLVQVIGAALILVFGLKFLGVVRIPLLDRVVRADEQRFKTRFGAVNAVLMGLLFAAGWSPCVGPVLGAVLTYTASAAHSPARGALYLAVYGLGLATPLLATAALADASGRWLKRLRPWIPRLERALGAVLVVAALWTGVSGGLALARSGGGSPAAVADLTGGRQPVIVELYSHSCTACKAMQPIVDALTRQCSEHNVAVRQVEVGEPLGRTLVARHHVLGVPTFLVFDRDGALVKQMVGGQTEAALKDAVSGLAETPCPAANLAPPPVLEVPPCAPSPGAPANTCSPL